MTTKAQLAQAARPSQAFCFIVSHGTASARGVEEHWREVGPDWEGWGGGKGAGQAGGVLPDRQATAQESAAGEQIPQPILSGPLYPFLHVVYLPPEFPL